MLLQQKKEASLRRLHADGACQIKKHTPMFHPATRNGFYQTRNRRKPCVLLQVLEDKTGVFVNGLSQVPVLGWEAALDVLSQGVLNRTTASTLMNTVSSRSHAVFTITLTQTLKDEADPEGEPQVCLSFSRFFWGGAIAPSAAECRRGGGGRYRGRCLDPCLDRKVA